MRRRAVRFISVLFLCLSSGVFAHEYQYWVLNLSQLASKIPAGRQASQAFLLNASAEINRRVEAFAQDKHLKIEPFRYEGDLGLPILIVKVPKNISEDFKRSYAPALESQLSEFTGPSDCFYHDDDCITLLR